MYPNGMPEPDGARLSGSSGRKVSDRKCSSGGSGGASCLAIPKRSRVPLLSANPCWRRHPGRCAGGPVSTFFLRVLDPEVLLPSLEEECRPFFGRGWPSSLPADHLVQGASLSSRQWGDHPLDPLEKRRILEEIPLLWPLFLLTEEVEGGQGKREIQRQAFALLSEETIAARSLLIDRGKSPARRKKERERAYSAKETRTGREAGYGV